MNNVTRYQRDFIKHPQTGRVLATVTKIGENLHLDLAQVLRADEARALGHALAHWSLPSTWGDEDVPAPRQGFMEDSDPDGCA